MLIERVRQAATVEEPIRLINVSALADACSARRLAMASHFRLTRKNTTRVEIGSAKPQGA